MTVESEFPQCDPRYVGQPYRHGWYTSPDGELASTLEQNDSFYNVVGHYDHETGAVDRYSCGQAMTSEALFVPASEDAAEGEGYLLSVVTSFETRTSSLLYLQRPASGRGPGGQSAPVPLCTGGFSRHLASRWLMLPTLGLAR